MILEIREGEMKKLIFVLMLLAPGLLLAQFPYGHGNFIIVTSDTVNIDKTSNYFYYYSTDGKLYFSKGGYLVNLGASDGDLTVTGTITGSIFIADGASGTRFYGETPNTSDAVVHLKRTDGSEVKLIAGATNGSVGTTTNHALILQSNNANRLSLNGGGTAFSPITTGQVYLGSESMGFRGLFIDGKKSTANLLEIGNDNDGSMGDSSIYITSTANMVFPNNRWLQWKNSGGTPTNVIKYSNGDAITLNSAAVYLLPDETGKMFLGSEALGWRGVYVEGKKLNDDLAIFTNEADGAEGDSTSKINSKAQFVSAVPVGVAPFVITSTTVNTNLNADLLDGVSIAGIVRTAECWVYYDVQNPALVSLPANAKVLSVEMWVYEAFNSDGADAITIGYDADDDAYGTSVDVSGTGVKTVTLGATAKTVDATARAVECYYTNGGTEPSAGFAHISITWIQSTGRPEP
jgi:hypothetical protein